MTRFFSMLAGVAVLGLGVSAGSAMAEVLAFDEFDGNSGGFSNAPWTELAGITQSGGQLQLSLQDAGGWTSSDRTFATPITFADNQSVWMAYTVQASSDFSGYFFLENVVNGFAYFKLDLSSGPATYGVAGQSTPLGVGSTMTGLVKLTYDGANINTEGYYATTADALLDASGNPVGTPLTGPAILGANSLSVLELQFGYNAGSNPLPKQGSVSLERISFATTASEALNVPVPEPASLALLGIGGTLLALRRRRLV